MGRMARSLKPIEAGYATLIGSESDGASPEELVFDPADWRFELGSWAASPAPVKFDPHLCALDPEQMGFTPGWSSVKS